MASRRQVRRAIELYEEGLSARPEVVGIGAHWDTRKTVKGSDREHAVAVYVASGADLPRSGENHRAEQIPATVEIPARGGVHIIPIVVMQIDELKPENAAVESEMPQQDEGEGLFYVD